MCEQNQNCMINMGFTDNKYPVGTHMCLIYSSEKERRDLSIKFLAAGIRDNQMVGFFSDNWELDDLKSGLAAEGIDVDSAEDTGQLKILNVADAYYPEGIFSAKSMLANLDNTCKKSLKDGYIGYRASGEMTWSLQDIPGSDQLIEYEREVNRIVKVNPLTALSQYDANRFDGSTLNKVLRAHPFTVVRGQIVHNPQYEVIS